MHRLLFLLLLSTPAGAQEWTRFRGPGGFGISSATGVAVEWTEKDFLWRVKHPGKSHSHPVLWGDRIFLTSALEEGRERAILCLHREEGRTLWIRRFPMGSLKVHDHNSYASGTPAVDKDAVYAFFADAEHQMIKAFDHEGGKLWSHDLGAFSSMHGHGSSPLLFEGKVIVPNDQRGKSSILALAARTGKPIWECSRKGSKKASFSTPSLLLRENAAPELLTTSLSHGISSIDPRNGSMNWEARVFDKRTVASPVVAGNLALGSCGSGGGGIYVAAVRLGGKGDVTKSHLAYTIRKAAPYVPSLLVVRDRLFMISDKGIASWADAATGRVLWSKRLEGTFYASPVLVEGRIYCNSREGKTFVLEAGETFRLLAVNPLGEGCYGTPCVDGNRLYMKTFTHVLCIDKR